MTIQELIQTGSYSTAGRKPENQDATCTQVLEYLVLAALADGASGCQKPREASQLLLQLFCEQLQLAVSNQSEPPMQAHIDQMFTDALQRANEALFFAKPIHVENTKPVMLSTLAAVLMDHQYAYMVHVGDSRIYHFNHFELTQLTRDHQHESGRYKGALSQVLGFDLAVNADYHKRTLKPGDLFLLTTDGIHQYLSNEELAVLLREVYQPETARDLNTIAERIAFAAHQSGSRDNLSCVIVTIDDAMVSLNEQKTVSMQTQRLQFPPALQVDSQLDHFVIKQELYTSSRSSVYLAHDTHSGKARVIKVLSENFSEDQVNIERFIKEERTGLRFDHQSLIKFYPKPIDSRYLYHVTEYIHGQSLKTYLEQHAPLSVAICFDLVSKIVVGLRVLHRSHLLHQDLKPENVMLSSTGDIKILDLGAAGSLILKDSLTVPAGALEYTAPEYFTGGKIGIQADLFSLAVIIYQMLTARLPFSAQQLMHRPHALDIIPPTRHNPQLPVWIDHVLLRALSEDLVVRHQALSELMADLDEKAHYSERKDLPLIERYPMQFWQVCLTISVLINLILLYFLLN